MIRAEYRFHLPVPPEQGFDVLSDPTRDPEWQSACAHTRLLDGAVGAGCRYEIAFQILGRRLDFTVEITDFIPGRHSRFVTVEGPFRYVGSYHYHRRADGTTDVQWTFDVDPGDYFGILPEVLLKKVLINQVKKDSSSLSKQLAAAPPPS
ncbi:MAG: RND transporter [Micromonosporaceae bacterium]|nr:RND transporter [Micromonosporaceae bacterium]